MTPLEAKGRIRFLQREAGELPQLRQAMSRKTARLDEIEAEIKECRQVVADADAAPGWLSAMGSDLFADEAHGGMPASIDLTNLPRGMKYVPPGAVTTKAVLGEGDTGLRVAPVRFGEMALRTMWHAASTKSRTRVDLGSKAFDDLETDLPPTLGPVITRATEPQRIATLFPGVAMLGPVIEYPCITGTSGNPPAVVAPGGVKPQSDVVTSMITAHAQKIAGIVVVQDESFDFPGFVQIVQGELVRSLIAAENFELLLGDGTTGHLDGLVHQAGLHRTAATGENGLDVVEQGITDIRSGSSFAAADAVVMNPADFSAIRRLKSTTGEYLTTTSPTSDVPESIFGLRVVLTSDCPVGTAVVGAFAYGAALHVRLGLILEANNRGDTEWTHNLTSFRAETRECLAVYRPSCFNVLTLTPAA